MMMNVIRKKNESQSQKTPHFPGFLTRWNLYHFPVNIDIYNLIVSAILVILSDNFVSVFIKRRKS